jgi:hypothetical protein
MLGSRIQQRNRDFCYQSQALRGEVTNWQDRGEEEGTADMKISRLCQGTTEKAGAKEKTDPYNRRRSFQVSRLSILARSAVPRLINFPTPTLDRQVLDREPLSLSSVGCAPGGPRYEIR